MKEVAFEMEKKFEKKGPLALAKAWWKKKK